MKDIGKLKEWVRLEHEGTPVWIQPTVPDWFVPNLRADLILSAIASGAGLHEAAARYAQRYGVDPALAVAQAIHLLERMPSRQPAPIRPRH